MCVIHGKLRCMITLSMFVELERKRVCLPLQDEIRADLDSKSVSDMSLDTISAVSNLSNTSDSTGEQPSTPGVSRQTSPSTSALFSLQLLHHIVATSF